MNSKAILHGGMMLAIVLLVLSHAGDVPAQSAFTAGTLSDAYANLAQAKPRYKGHRVRAMGHIKTAARLVGGKVSVRGTGLEPGGDSDAKLRAAQGLLHRTRAGMSGKPLEQVNKALAELSAALSVR